MSPDELTPEQLAFRDSVRGFLGRLIPPDRVDEIEAAGEVPADVWTAFAEQELLAVGVPAEHGGSGGGAVELALLVRELAAVSLSVAMRYLASAYSGVHALISHGTPSQRSRLLDPYLRGEAEFGLGFTEPSGGADIRGWRTTARREGDGWVLDGAKTFTSNADKATRLLVIARTEAAEKPHQGLTLFLVDPRASGVDMRRLGTMGLKAEAAFEMSLTGSNWVPTRLSAVPGRGSTRSLGRSTWSASW